MNENGNRADRKQGTQDSVQDRSRARLGEFLALVIPPEPVASETAP